MFEDKETCCFMHLVYRFLHDDTYYLLHVKEHEKINPNKILLGYYDNDYVYIIPSVLIGAIDNLTFQAGLALIILPVFQMIKIKTAVAFIAAAVFGFLGYYLT